MKSIFRSLSARGPLLSEWGRMFYLSYVSIARFPSEALVAAMDRPRDQLAKLSKSHYHSSLCLREFPDGDQYLLLKLRTRNRATGVAVLMRPCFCSGNISACSGLCSIHDFWMDVCVRTPHFQPLFPSLLNKTINRALEGSLRSVNITGARKYPTHAFRRGASVELKRPGRSPGAALKAVGRNSASFRPYLSFVEGEGANIRLVLAYASDGADDDHFADCVDDASPPPFFNMRGRLVN